MRTAEAAVARRGRDTSLAARALVTGNELSGRRAFPRPTTPPSAAVGHRKVVLRLPRGHRALVANAPPNI